MSIRENAIEEFELDGLQCFIALSPMGQHRKNGYCIFPARPTLEAGYRGILAYVPVHGGITYAKDTPDGMIYGFDTGHNDSHEFPIDDSEWIKKQISIMIQGIRVAVGVEESYLKRESVEECVELVSGVCPDQWYNLGVAINLLAGEL